MKGKKMKDSRGNESDIKNSHIFINYGINERVRKHVRTFFLLVQCTHEDRIQFSKNVIELIETEYRAKNGNVRSRGKIMTIADKRKAKIEWKFDEMDKNE